MLPEFDLLHELDHEICQGDVCGLESEPAPRVRDEVGLDLAPKALNLQRFHVLSIDVHN